MRYLPFLLLFLLTPLSLASRIEPALARQVMPLLHDWLAYYDLDISAFSCPRAPCVVKYCMRQFQPLTPDAGSIYQRAYTPARDDVEDPVLFEYSPDKRYYLNIAENSGVYKTAPSHYAYAGGDDNQEIYLFDRQAKRVDLILWLGSSEFAEMAYWREDGRLLAIVGSTDDGRFFIKLNNVMFYQRPAAALQSPKERYFIYRLKRQGVTFPP